MHPAVISEEDVDKNQGHIVSSLHGLDVSEDEPPVPTSQYIKHMVAKEQEKKARKGNTLLKYDFDSESYPVFQWKGTASEQEPERNGYSREHFVRGHLWCCHPLKLW